MSSPQLFARTLQHVGEYLEQDVSQLTPESSLRTAAPGLDSLKIFEMMLYLEECFGIDFEEGLAGKINTLGELADYIDGRLGQGDAQPDAGMPLTQPGGI